MSLNFILEPYQVKIKITGDETHIFQVQVSVFSPAAGLKSDQFDRKRN